MGKALKKINLRSSDEILKLNPDEIPTLVPSSILSQWMEGDSDPYYKIQKIDYPIIANRYNYTEAFFDSFVSKLNSRPIPGSKDGHETSWGKRGNTDILLVGAKMDKNGDGTGSVYLKNYFPPAGNETLIKEAKSDMIEFSLVSYTRDSIEEKPDGSVSYNVVESMYGERNDIVGYGEGAMDQKTNAVSDQELISASVTKARRLINAGDYDATSSWSFSAADGNAILGPNGDDWQNYGSWHLVRDTAFDDNTKAGFKYPYGKNDKVYRSALNAIAQRAAQAGLDNVSQAAQSLRDLIDKKENKGVTMDKEQVLNALTTLKENLAVTLPEIAKHLNLSELIVTDEQKTALVKMNAVKALCGDADPVEFIKGILEERKQNAAAVREANIAEHFGAKQIDGKENKVRTYVDSIIGTAELTDEKLNEIKQNSIFQTLAAEQAQFDSDFNRIGASEKQNVSSGPKVMDF